MLATFVLVEPASAAVAFVAVVAAAAYARAVRRPAPQVSSAGAAASRARPAGLLTVPAAGLAAVGLAAVLLLAKTPGAHALLLAFSGLAVLVLSVESYRRRPSKPGSGRAAVCILARVVAWLAVLVMIGRPLWEWVLVDWEKPLLVVLLDQSESMSITDRDSPDERSRAERVNRTLAEARSLIEQLDRLYEVQTFGVGEGQELLDGWRIVPRAPVSAIAAALRRAGQTRSVHGEPPVAVLLVSDGAENAASPRVVSGVATELGAQQTALLAVGVGPAAGLSPAVVLDPLVVPLRIGSRDRLRVPVGAYVTGCEGHAVKVSLLWDDDLAEQRDVAVERPAQRLATEFELQPPGVGLHRLTAKATLPVVVGGESFETSVVVDVDDDRIRVLLLEAQPHNELAFAARALRGEPRFELEQRLLLGEGPERMTTTPAAAPRWTDYDVVVLGNVPAKRLSFDALTRLADAVREGGVGLLMVGGRDFYHAGYYSRSELPDVSPVDFTLSRPSDDYRPRLRVTENGRRHAVLLGVGATSVVGDGEAQAGEIWDALPPLTGAARFGKPKPLAVILAADQSGRPLMAALDVGRGRCIAAGWDSTWPWALCSEEGLVVHRRLWRQMVAWLANRRPVAWIVTDRSSYAGAALSGRRQRLLIRAGLSGVETLPGHARRGEFKASLHLRRGRAGNDARPGLQMQPPGSAPTSRPTTVPAQEIWTIPLKRRGSEWEAELPRDLHTQTWLVPGLYELTFTVEQTAAGRPAEPASSAQPGTGERLLLTARTGFTLVGTDLELQEPTANLALLREAATRTSSVGGGYHPVEELPDALRRLTETDRRRRIERRAAYDPTRRQPWLLLGLVAGALGLEWVVRKRGGMA